MVKGSTSLVVSQGLMDILQPLRIQQREYLLLRLTGVDKDDSLALVERKEWTIGNWEKEVAFHDIEDFLMSNREKYVEDAAKQYAAIVRAEAIIGLAIIARKVNKWETLDKVDKQSVLTALKELRNVGISIEGSSKGSYERMVLERGIHE